mgnify:FL=1
MDDFKIYPGRASVAVDGAAHNETEFDATAQAQWIPPR